MRETLGTGRERSEQGSSDAGTQGRTIVIRVSSFASKLISADPVKLLGAVQMFRVPDFRGLVQQLVHLCFPVTMLIVTPELPMHTQEKHAFEKVVSVSLLAPQVLKQFLAPSKGELGRNVLTAECDARVSAGVPHLAEEKERQRHHV